MTAPHQSGDEGFTLIEVMISLGLFALIAVAGLAMVEGILGVQARTEIRLDRLTEIQRVMYVIGNDLQQISAGDVRGDAGGVEFQRSAPGLGGIAVPMQYRLTGGTLFRIAAGQPQLLLAGVGAARWRFLGDDWQAKWPPDPEAPPSWPRAIEFEFAFAEGTGPPGTLRKLVVLPARPGASIVPVVPLAPAAPDTP